MGFFERLLKEKRELEKKGEENLEEHEERTLDAINVKLKKREKLNVIWEKDLKNLKIEPVKWYVDNYIPKDSIVFWAGKRASFKSFALMHLSICLSEGIPVFNKFGTEKVNVLYIDEENGISVIKERIEQIKNSLGISYDLENLGFLSRESFKVKDEIWRKKLEKYLKKNSPCVIIVDAFRRIISCDENQATEMNSVFTEDIQPLVKKYNTTWILIHHLRKGIAGRNSSDKMEELRGSSEIANYADVVLMFERKGHDRVILRQLKCRRAMEQQGAIIEIKWQEDNSSVGFNCVGTAEDIINDVEICAKKIFIWVEEEGLEYFKTKEAKEKFKKDHSARTIDRALNELKAQGKLIKPKRGIWVPAKDVQTDLLPTRPNCQDNIDSK